MDLQPLRPSCLKSGKCCQDGGTASKWEFLVRRGTWQAPCAIYTAGLGGIRGYQKQGIGQRPLTTAVLVLDKTKAGPSRLWRKPQYLKTNSENQD